ncbi:MAG TPA: acyl-CoA dehydrogenase family protein [Stellaceae bacterium]|jgi:3-hydroxy-9,10-secoandrosta-1,3,5(10)-triene-9,17-dione monooxygenase|nr:acyl-CoA dehydrogenase family protein [Stellaceae bacterium]
MFVTGPRFALNYHGMTIRYEEAIERARSIIPVAKKNTLAAEELRRIPEENARAIFDSGLMPLMRPKMFGGYEGDWMTQIDCVSEVASVCGSTGWCMTFFIQHQYFLSLFGLEAQRYVYERQPDPTILTSFNQTGKVKEVTGGYEIGGRWHFASAGDYCQWAIVGGVTRNEDGSIKKRLNFLLKPGEFKIDRVWNAIGLKGSGSNDVIVEPTFVPNAFVYDHDEALVGRAAGQSVHEGVLYRSPLILNSGFAVMTPMHGIARGAFEAFVALTAGRGARPLGAKPSDRVDVQIAIGQSKAEIDLAYLITEKLVATVFEGKKVTRDDVVRQRRDMMMLQKLLQSGVDRLFDLSGAHGLLGDSVIQRHWRDLHAIGHHAQWAAPALQIAGRDALGLPPLPSDTYPLD